MCMPASGAAIDAAGASREDANARTAEGRQRQPDGLAVCPVSVWLARVELISQIGKMAPEKAQRRASGISSLGGVR